MYTSFNIQARNMILYFIDKYFKDTAGLVVPIHPLNIQIDEEQMKKIFIGNNYNEDYKILSHYVRELGENIPPLVNAYMSLSPSMKMFGTAINPDIDKNCRCIRSQKETAHFYLHPPYSRKTEREKMTESGTFNNNIKLTN